MEDTILVSCVKSSDDAEPILVVGRKRPNESLEIVNAFQGEEATYLYKKLITKKENNYE
jgi:hypothetical protein